MNNIKLISDRGCKIGWIERKVINLTVPHTAINCLNKTKAKFSS